MNNDEKILKLRKVAQQLGIKIHLASMDFSKDEMRATKVQDKFNIVFIDSLVNNETAFYIQQHRNNNEKI